MEKTNGWRLNVPRRLTGKMGRGGKTKTGRAEKLFLQHLNAKSRGLKCN